jgi:hypothetical protein
VRIAFGEPIEVAEDVPTREAARELVEEELWPEVEREFGLLRQHRGLIGAAVAALGLAGGAALRGRRRSRSRRSWPWERRKSRRGRR